VRRLHVLICLEWIRAENNEGESVKRLGSGIRGSGFGFYAES